MSNKDLDNIFKEGLSSRNVDFNMESWRRMEQMLPPEPVKGRFMIYKAAAVIGVLLLLSVSLFVWQTNDGENAIAKNGANSSSPNELSIVANQSNESKEGTSDEAIVNAQNETDIQVTSMEEEALATTDNEEENTLTSNQVTGSTSILSKATQMSFESGKNSSSGIGGGNSSNQQALGIRNQTSGSLSINDRSNQREQEEMIAFSSSPFTKIDGLEELEILALENEDVDIVVANVANGKLPKVNRNLFGFIGGINLQNSLVNSSNSNSIGVSEFLGVTYEHFLNGGFSIKANLLYSARGDVNASKMYDKKVYDFGSSTEQTFVECQRLINLELPVMANYNIGNHNVFVGASASYLLSGYNKVTTNYTDISDSWSEEKSEWGYTNGFKTFDFALVAGYEYSISPRFNIGTRLNYGLVDLTDNNYFQSDSFDNNVQLRLYLKFTPFQF